MLLNNNNNNNNNNNDIINFNAIQERFDMLEQNQLFEVGDFIGIHNYINTGPNNWRRLSNNFKLLMLDIYKELALLMWH